MSEHIETNIGSIPIEDYLDIKAQQYGFEDYQDLQSAGFSLEVPVCNKEN